jgi:hypothetical protein
MVMAPRRNPATAAISVVRPTALPWARETSAYAATTSADTGRNAANSTQGTPLPRDRKPATAPTSANRMKVRSPMPCRSSLLRFSRSTPIKAPISSAVAKSQMTPRSKGPDMFDGLHARGWPERKAGKPHQGAGRA